MAYPPPMPALAIIVCRPVRAPITLRHGGVDGGLVGEDVDDHPPSSSTAPAARSALDSGVVLGPSRPHTATAHLANAVGHPQPDAAVAAGDDHHPSVKVPSRRSPPTMCSHRGPERTRCRAARYPVSRIGRVAWPPVSGSPCASPARDVDALSRVWPAASATTRSGAGWPRPAPGGRIASVRSSDTCSDRRSGSGRRGPPMTWRAPRCGPRRVGQGFPTA